MRDETLDQTGFGDALDLLCKVMLEVCSASAYRPFRPDDPCLLVALNADTVLAMRQLAKRLPAMAATIRETFDPTPQRRCHPQARRRAA